MESKILKGSDNKAFSGCDFVVQLPESRRGKRVRILQITDTQIIDATQRRTEIRLRPDEIEVWDPANFDIQCADHIRALVTQARPDLIIITGDIVYGSFDDSGRTLAWICSFMDSLRIPWAPVFGNHDNESAIGVTKQCEMLASSSFCLFERGEVSGNSNYSVGIAIGDELIRLIHMLDSNGCSGSDEDCVIKERGIYPDQLELVRKNTELATAAQGRAVPAFAAFHIPVVSFREAEIGKGYAKDEDDRYVLGVDVPAKDRDFGFSLEKYIPIVTEVDFAEFMRAQNVDGVFVGHVHKNSFSISYNGIVWTFGLKTGQYDYHIPYQLGATMITLDGAEFEVNHIVSLSRCASMPGRAKMFCGLLAMGKD